MITTPPQIDPTDLYPQAFAQRILGITVTEFEAGVAYGDLRQVHKAEGNCGNHTWLYKGTDIYYYYFKYKKIRTMRTQKLFAVSPTERVVGQIQHPKGTCRECKHRFSVPLNQWSKQVLQCCELKPGKNNAGYKTIKVTDKACADFIDKNKQLND